MSICSIKFFEMSKQYHVYQGRLCYRGDNIRDEHRVVAVLQELSSSPASIQSANCCIAYACLPGNTISFADAMRAYIQSYLRSSCPTWVRIPKELWPADGSWEKRGFKKPLCLFERALYGHPESGGHWERHLNEAVKSISGVAVPGHPSCFWFPVDKSNPKKELHIMLCVYVDDLLMSRPPVRTISCGIS